MTRSNRALVAMALAVAAAQASCSSDDPIRMGRPPVVQTFSPSGHSVVGLLGDTLQFRIQAFDPDGDPLTALYELDGAPVANSMQWGFAISDTGAAVVRGTVSDGEYSAHIEWQVSRYRPVNLPPVIEAAQPVETNPTLVIGNRMDFAILASDPEGRPLTYTMTVNDSLVARDRQFNYLATSVGWKYVRAVASDGEYSVGRDWQLRVTAVPDTIAPAEVAITYAATGAEPGEVDVEWIAVGRDGMLGLPSFYEVRTAPDPILSEYDWSRASNRPGVPAPAAAGESMGMTIGGLVPARLTYVSVRAFDDFGNRSPLGPPVSATTRGMRFGGRVLDAMTGSALSGAQVTFGVHEATTDASGSYSFADLGPAEGLLAARDEVGTGVGGYYDYVVDYYVRHDEVVDLYLLPNYQLQTTLYTDFLAFFRSMTDIAGHPYGAEQHRWKLPIDLYVRPYAVDGLDYKAVISSVSGEFDAIVGTQTYNLVASAPPVGVQTAYNTVIDRDRYTVIKWDEDWYPEVGLVEFRTTYTPATQHVLAVTTRHELGHALGLNHSLDSRHLMVGGQAPIVPTFAPDEIAVIRCLCGIPRGWNNRLYERD